MKPFSLLLLLLLASCGSIAENKANSSVYQQPTGNNLVRIRVISNGVIKAIPNSSCIDWRKPGAGVIISSKNGFHDLRNQNLKMPKGVDLSTLSSGVRAVGVVRSEIYAEASKPIVIKFDGADNNILHQCSKEITFSPENKTDYEAIFLQDGSTCTVELRKNPSKKIPAKLLNIEELDKVYSDYHNGKNQYLYQPAQFCGISSLPLAESMLFNVTAASLAIQTFGAVAH